MEDGVEIHSLYWDNFNRDMLVAHRKVMERFEVPVRYHERTVPHDVWCDEVARASTADVLGFIEPDLIPLNAGVVPEALAFVRENDTLLGCAQVSNQFYPPTHVYASPAFFFITRSCYLRLGQPSFRVNARADAGQEVSYAADRRGVRYRTLYPTHYERDPDGGVWPLGNYGWFGVGTVFAGRVYHLFQSRLGANVDLFTQRCAEVVEGTFSTEGFYSSTDLSVPNNPSRFGFPNWGLPRKAVNGILRRMATKGI